MKRARPKMCERVTIKEDLKEKRWRKEESCGVQALTKHEEPEVIGKCCKPCRPNSLITSNSALN